MVKGKDVEDVIFRGIFPSFEEGGSLRCQGGCVQNDAFLFMISLC